MFAILLHKDMYPFYQNISSFPTIVYSALLVICVIYWAGAVLGMFDIDFINIDADLDLNADSGYTAPDVLAGLLIKFKLVGVPVVITLSLIVLFGWFISYYMVHFLLGSVENGYLRFLFGIPILGISLIAAAWLTTFAMAPFRSAFGRLTGQAKKHILGQRAIVRTSRVDANFGEAVMEDGCAGLILKIRSSGNETFVKGDRVVIFEKLNDNNHYRVMSEKEFSGQ